MASTVKTTISIGGVLEPSVQAAFNKINKCASNTTQKFAKVASQTAAIASKMAKITGGAIAAGTALATKSFADLEQSTANVSATLGKNSTPEVLEAYSKKAIELSDNMSKSAKEIMDGFNYLALAGWSTKDSLANVEFIVKSSVVSGMELATCSDKITDSLSALGLSAKDTAKYADLLALAQTKGNATFENLLDSLLASGGTFTNFKVPLNETVAILDKLADQGLKGSEAGNAMNSILTNMLAIGGQAADAMEALGLSIFDDAGKTRNMTEVIAELNEKLSGCTEEQRDTYIAMIAGKNHLDDFNKLLATTGNGVVDLAKDLKDTDGALEKAAITIDDTILGKLKILKNTIMNTGSLMVKQFAPNIKKSIESVQAKVLSFRPKLEAFTSSLKNKMIAISKSKTFINIKNMISSVFDFIYQNTPIVIGIISEAISNISNIMQSEGFQIFKDVILSIINTVIKNIPNIISIVNEFIPVILGIGAAMATLKIAGKVSKFIGIIGKIGGVVGKIAFALKSVSAGAATLGEAMAFLMGPIGWIVLAIGAVVAIVAVLWNKCEPFREMIGSLVSQVAGWVKETLLPALQSIGEKLSTLWNEVISPFLQYISDEVQPIFATVFEFIGSKISAVFEFIGNLISSALQIFGGLIDFITGIFTENWSLAWQGIQDIFGGIFNGLISLAKAPLNAIIGLVNKAIGGINSLGSVKLPKVLGGGTVGINIPEIPMLARGGITNIPSICGEAGPEAVIPLKRNNPRSLSLLEKTAGAIGAKGKNNEGHTFVFAPNISGNVTDEEIRKIKEEYEDFKEWVLSVFDDERRTDFA